MPQVVIDRSDFRFIAMLDISQIMPNLVGAVWEHGDSPEDAVTALLSRMELNVDEVELKVLPAAVQG